MGTTATQIGGYQKTLFETQASNGHTISHDGYRRGRGRNRVFLTFIF